MRETPSGTIILPRPSIAGRRITMGVQKHFTGNLVVGEDEGQVIEFESHTERQTALVMLAREEVVDLESQIPFNWVDQAGKARTHFFDFRVSLSDGARVALIVKNSRKAAKPDFVAEMRVLARQVTANFASRVSLITEMHLDPIEVHNAELVHGVRLSDPEPDEAVREVVASIDGAVKIKDIVAATKYAGRSFLAVVRMIRSHQLELINHERIEPGVFVRRRQV